MDETTWEVIDTEFDDGELVTIRQRWVGCEPPGPIGSGADYIAIELSWNLADDGVWERTIYRWTTPEELADVLEKTTNKDEE